MKSLVTVLVVSVVLFSGTFHCQAMPGPWEPPPGCGEPSFRESFPAGLARILELSEAQKGQIRAILNEEMEKGQSQHQKEAELREQLHQVERTATFNEQAVRSAAAALAGLETERVVLHARTRYRISTVLTAAQRSLAERLLPERDERPAPQCGCGNEGRHRQGPADNREWRYSDGTFIGGPIKEGRGGRNGCEQTGMFRSTKRYAEPVGNDPD